MAYSGTIGSTTFTTRKVIDHAFRRCKVSASKITGEHVDIAKDCLFLMLQQWSAMQINLWCLETVTLPVYEGKAAFTLPVGTIDVLNANLRLLQEPTGTRTSAASYEATQLDEEQRISAVGVLWSGVSDVLLFQTSTDGVGWTTVQTVADPQAVAGEWSWFDVEELTLSTYYRIVANGGTLNDTTVFFGASPSEIPLSRMNRDEYFYLPNKTFLSERPLQYWLDRQADRCVMHTWPVPSQGDGRYQLVVKSHRSIMDVGSMTQQVEVPNRWYEAVVAGLAAKVAREIEEVDPRAIPQLDGDASSALLTVSMENRDNSPVSINPGIAGYTR